MINKFKPTHVHFAEADHVVMNPHKYTSTLYDICFAFLITHGKQPGPVTEQPCKPAYSVGCWDSQGNVITVDFDSMEHKHASRIMGWES